VLETSLRYEDFLEADEIFTSGNASKVMPVLKIDERSLQPGPFYTKARKAYWNYAHS
jgi:branched-chain amino acid aminotransferase